MDQAHEWLYRLILACFGLTGGGYVFAFTLYRSLLKEIAEKIEKLEANHMAHLDERIVALEMALGIKQAEDEDEKREGGGA